MDASRTPAQVTTLGDQLAFRDARIRVGADRFELSFGKEWKHIAVVSAAVFVMAGPVLPLLVFLPTSVALLLALLGACGTLAFLFVVLTGCQHLVVTRHGAWGVSTILGVRVAWHPLGYHPRVDNLGYDWQELAAYPRDERACARLHDHERFVLVEWADGDEARCRDGKHLQSIARAEVIRLHGDPSTASSSPGSPAAPR
ncbi:MAG: hypothetical protein ABI321_03585 [Polyangia bacterium]